MSAPSEASESSNSCDAAAEGAQAAPRPGGQALRKVVNLSVTTVAFAFGFFAINMLSAHQKKVEVAVESPPPAPAILERFEQIDKQSAEARTEQRESQKSQQKIETRVTEAEHGLASLTQTTERLADEIEARFEAVEARFGNFGQQLADMQLRLTKYEDRQQVAQSETRAVSEERVIEKTAFLPAPTPKPTARLSRYSLIRLDGRAAWIAAPEGWLHVAVGEKLPDGATVLEMSRQNNRSAVLTDQGVIKAGR